MKDRKYDLPDGSYLEVCDVDANALNDPGMEFLKDVLSMAIEEMRTQKSGGTIIVDGRTGPSPAFFSFHRNQADPEENGWVMSVASRPNSQAAFLLDVICNWEVLPGNPGDPPPFAPFHFEELDWRDRARKAVEAMNDIATRTGKEPLKWPGLRL